MQVLSLNQIQEISGGCARGEYKQETQMGRFLFSVAGAATGWYAFKNSPFQFVAAVVGGYIGYDSGYILGGLHYYISSYLQGNADAALKPPAATPTTTTATA